MTIVYKEEKWYKGGLDRFPFRYYTLFMHIGCLFCQYIPLKFTQWVFEGKLNFQPDL